jgi:hypothetical protein
VIFVLAPEDPMREAPLAYLASHPLLRLLHFSWVVRGGGGRKESYLIRLAQSDLDQRRIPYTGAIVGSGRGVVAAAAERIALTTGIRADFDAVTAPARTELNRVAAAGAELLRTAMAREPLPSGRVYARAPEQAPGLQREQFGAGLLRLLGPLRLDLSGSALGGGSVGPAEANDLLGARRDRSDRTRTRDLLEACMAEREVRRLLREDEAGEPILPPEVEEPPPADRPLTGAEADQILLSRAIGQVADLPSARRRLLLEELAKASRATPGTLQARLDALELKGGPADAVAYHDFHSLQIAFRSVWRRVFDDGLRRRGEELYERWVAVRRFVGMGEPDAAARAELADLGRLLGQVQSDLSAAAGLAQRTGTLPEWDGSAAEADSFFGPWLPGLPPIPGLGTGGLPAPPSPRDVVVAVTGGRRGVASADPTVARAADAPAAPASPSPNLMSRVRALALDLASRLSEPYLFDVFEPGSYNFGVMTTYRQRWEPVSYQAGELVASVPLAPGEKRKLTSKQVIKKTREETRAEASTRTSSSESTATSRADTEIVNRASSTTNFS